MTINFRRAVAIFLLLASAYLITYTGRIELGDQLEYFDAVGGVARFGQPLADEASWQTPPRGSSLRNDPPLRATIAEPLFIYAAAPVYFAAERMSGVGMLHAVWLFNIAMSPLVAVLTYALAMRVGISGRGAIFAALALGLLTIWWTYSQTFFREPMMMALLLLAAMALWDVPRATTARRRMLAAVTAAVMLVLAVLTKEAVVFALPGLAVLAIPPLWWDRRAFRRLALAALIAVAAAILILIYTPLLDWLAAQLPGGYLFTPAFEILPETTRVALHTYILSIGGSLWGTSPVLLLAIPGAWLLWRRQPAYVTAALLVAAGYAVGYALLRGEGSVGGNWFGGTIWPMRFLLPALPFAVILTAPAVEAAKSRWARIVVALVCLYSLWWQLSSVVFNWAAYDLVSADYSFGLTYWLPGFNAIEHLRPVALLRAIGTQPVNFAWARADILPYALLFAVPLAMSLFALRAGGRKAWAGLVASAVMLVALTYGGLRLLHDRDPLYMPERDDLRQAAALIRETVHTGGVVLVNDPETTWFWLNHGKVGRRWIVGLGYHPGDRGSFEQPILVESENAADEIASGAPRLIQRLAESRGRLWLFMDASSELPWARRPLERFMGERYYRIEDRYISPYARLLSYDTAPAPAWDEPAVPQVESPFTFTDPDTGDELRLLGYTLPEGEVFRPGRPLPVSLVWEADDAPSRDYTAALFVVRAEDPFVRVQAADSWLGATFKTTSLMPPGEAIWDHRAVMIPAGWQAGEYRLWLKLYYNDYNTGRITDLVATGSAVVEGDVAVLSGGIRAE